MQRICEELPGLSPDRNPRQLLIRLAAAGKIYPFVFLTAFVAAYSARNSMLELAVTALVSGYAIEKD